MSKERRERDGNGIHFMKAKEGPAIKGVEKTLFFFKINTDVSEILIFFSLSLCPIVLIHCLFFEKLPPALTIIPSCSWGLCSVPTIGSSCTWYIYPVLPWLQWGRWLRAASASSWLLHTKFLRQALLSTLLSILKSCMVQYLQGFITYLLGRNINKNLRDEFTVPQGPLMSLEG